MELQGKVRMLLEPKTGTSQQTGNAWMSQEVVLDYFWWSNQQQPSQVVMKMFGEDRIKQYNLQVNDEVNVRYHIEAHEYNGRWFNDTRIDSITFVGASASKNPQPQNQPADGSNIQQPTNTPQSQNNAPTGGENQGGDKNDGLPF